VSGGTSVHKSATIMESTSGLITLIFESTREKTKSRNYHVKRIETYHLPICATVVVDSVDIKEETRIKENAKKKKCSTYICIDDTC